MVSTCGLARASHARLGRAALIAVSVVFGPIDVLFPGLYFQTAAQAATTNQQAATQTGKVAVQATETIPAQANAPWPVLSYIDALTFASRTGLTTVYGGYLERSETAFNMDLDQMSQELGNAASGNSAVYANVDLGSGVDSIMLRVSLPSAVNGVEVRLGSPTGTLAGACIINNTGGTDQYRTVGCAVDPQIMKGKQSLSIRFTGPNTAMRFNWFAFWARDTVQKIDLIQKASTVRMNNQPAPIQLMTGQPVRSQALLPGANEKLGRTYGAWSPSKPGDCPKWLHDTYWVRGDDGKVYPTWHPPVEYDPETKSYCTFGHEHGDNPRGSKAADVGGMPAFGIVNEALAPNTVALQRNEDHFGHKVRVVNDIKMYDPKTGKPQTCSIALKLHQGTHSPDALVNTAHEIITWGRCDGQEPFNVKSFALFGVAGSFLETQAAGCTQPVVPGISPSPLVQPAGGATRTIPTRDCFLRGTQADQLNNAQARTTEFWLTSYTSAPGTNLYTVVEDPSRIYDPSSTTKIGRTVDLCYDPKHPLAATLRCQMTVAGSSGRVAWDDPTSFFRGARNGNSHVSGVGFANSPTAVVYTNAFGQTPRPAPDPVNGITVKQLVPTTGFAFKVDAQASQFPTVDFSAMGKNGVRAPN